MKQSQNQNNKRGRGRGRRQPQNQLSRNQESNGPDVKIRGNTSHIAEKYLTLARDALSSGDRVSAENYFQHAEHYQRIIAAAKENQKASENAEDQAANGDDQSSDTGRHKKKPRHNRNGKDSSPKVSAPKDSEHSDKQDAEAQTPIEAESSDDSSKSSQAPENISEEVTVEDSATDAVA